MRISVEHPSRDDLSKQSWDFYISDSWHGHEGIAVVLDRYTLSKRPTVGDKHRADSEWSRWGTAGFGGIMKLAKPPEVPQWVRARVVEKINESISFVQQSDASTHFAMPPDGPASEDR
jgi:hypothetical protein